MSNKTTISTADGNTFTIDADAFTNFWRDVREQLLEEAAAKDAFKEAVKEYADAIGVKPAVLSKYAKTRFKQEVKKLKEQAEVFEKLDEVLDGPSESTED